MTRSPIELFWTAKNKHCNLKQFYFFFCLARMFRLAMKRVSAFIYNFGDIKVVEWVIFLSTELVCSAAIVLTSFSEQ